MQSNTIRIGTKGKQTRTVIAGINNSPIFASSVPVVVNINGWLGIQASSARFKRDIRDMGDASGRLMKLRPVTFRYKEDPAGLGGYSSSGAAVATPISPLRPFFKYQPNQGERGSVAGATRSTSGEPTRRHASRHGLRVVAVTSH